MKKKSNNPRQITQRQFADLRRWLREYGDLSGIVHNVRTDNIVGGNQRSEVFDINDCHIEITYERDETDEDGRIVPDEQGTIALGYVVWNGARYNYRRVDWDVETEDAACVISNKAGGNFDWDKLANEWNVDDLLEWGFDEKELFGQGVGLDRVEFKEYDESIADDVQYTTCPKCGATWPT